MKNAKVHHYETRLKLLLACDADFQLIWTPGNHYQEPLRSISRVYVSHIGIQFDWPGIMFYPLFTMKPHVSPLRDALASFFFTAEEMLLSYADKVLPVQPGPTFSKISFLLRSMVTFSRCNSRRRWLQDEHLHFRIEGIFSPSCMFA